MKDFVDDLLASDADADMIVLGDLNEFEFISPVLAARREPHQSDDAAPAGKRALHIRLQGNSQSLDHILVTDGHNSSPNSTPCT